MTIGEGIKDLFDTLTTKQVLLVVAAAALIGSIAISMGAGLSWFRIRSLEKDVAAAKERADALETKALVKEKEAARYQEKIVFLEGNLTEIQKLARKQDENLQRLDPAVAGARADAERARRVRSITSTADELCRQLEQVGHPCSE